MISKALDAFSTKYENIILLGGFNVCVDDETMINLCNSYSLNSLIKQPICFKNTESPSCIDLILTNKPRSFQSTCVMETRLSNFHRMTVSVLKKYFRKLLPKVITYRDFKKFENERFIDSLKSTLNNQDGDYTKNPQQFFELCQNELEYYAPRKKSTAVCVSLLRNFKREYFANLNEKNIITENFDKLSSRFSLIKIS